MKTNLLDIQGKKVKEIQLPVCFSQKVREDILSKVLEAKKIQQPYAPSIMAGKQTSASGKIVHRRHVWKSQYGRGMSRVPRKIMLRRGSQFNWVGAFVPQVRGGLRAHPPKVISMINTKKINKKELRIALFSAISATGIGKKLVEKYGRLKNEKIENIPFVVESKFVKLKTKDILSSLKKILGNDLFEVAVKKKKIRSGKGKMRGRKYKSNAGVLIVTGKDEKIKTKKFDVVNTQNLSVNDLAKGGSGRLTIYTENAIKDLGELK